MNQGQQQFLDYILERVKDDKSEEATTLLKDCFQKQDEGNFSQEDISRVVPKITDLIKPEKVEEVQGVMKQFAGSHSSKH
jgi:hypothetical protein